MYKSLINLAKRITEKQKDEIILGFMEGESIASLSEKFDCTKVTIIRNIKKNIGVLKYQELINKSKSLKQHDLKKENVGDIEVTEKNYKSDLNTKNISYEKEKDEKFVTDETFFEITPLDYEIESYQRKEISSVPISEIDFPKTVYMVVNNKIELEIKLLKDYPDWQFLPIEDLNRKTIEIYLDIKTAKQFCNREQKVIKVPNTNVFKVVAPLLLSRGISRIVRSDTLISL